jgi:hypothetical protein
MKTHLLILVALLTGTSTLAGAPPQQKKQQPAATPRPAPCQEQAPDRTQWPNGTLLWGMTRQTADDETSSVLASLNLERVRLASGAVKKVRLEKGRLAVPGQAPEKLVGAVLQGQSSDGKQQEVAVCSAEPDATDPALVRYRIEVWQPESATWKNPCIDTHRYPKPRAMAVKGVWDQSGARREVPGKFTFACETGAIAKCIDWGYKPWEVKEGRSLEELHQACTRMARADYCGNGRSHTREDTPIDMYDGLKVLTRTTETSAAWQPERASFEASWTPEGAACVARTRDGQALEAIQAECPERFEASTADLGEGDRCVVSRKGARAETALLRNRSYGRSEQAGTQKVAP